MRLHQSGFQQAFAMQNLGPRGSLGDLKQSALARQSPDRRPIALASGVAEQVTSGFLRGSQKSRRG